MAGLFLLIVLSASSARGDLADCIDATCRITGTDGGKGTGCVFEVKQGYVYVLTAAHVVENAQAVQCEFWQQGHLSGKLPSIAIRKRTDCDVAIVVLRTSVFGGRLPKAMPIASASRVMRPGETLTSVGCAKGAWSTGWKGHALGYRDGDLLFTPTPADGRSGSAIFDAGGTMIVGVLRARDAINGTSFGIATSIQTLRSKTRAVISAKGQRTQCGPDGCEIPGKRPILPYGGKYIPWKKQQPQQQQSANPWPTLPAPTPVPIAPAATVDLTPIGDKLDVITDLLLDMQADVNPIEPVLEPLPFVEPPQLPTEARIARQMAESNHGMILAIQDETIEGLAAVNGRIKTTEDNLGTALGQIEELAKNHGSLKDRMEARMEKVRGELGEEASKRAVRIAYLKDLIAEKVGDGGLVGLFKLLGLPVAVIIAAWFIKRDFKDRRETGDPLMITKLWEGLGEVRGRLHERVGGIRDRLHGDDDPQLVPPVPAKAD